MTQSPDLPTGVLDRISRALDGAGLDVSHALYDEAVDLARQGLLGPAHDRIRMLLCLDPDDGAAHLLLAKVLVAQTRWCEALAHLDAAREAGEQVPPSLQAEVETNLDQAASDGRAVRQASQQSEMRTMRDETRRLRTENTRLLRDRRMLKSRVNIWSTSTAILAGVSIVLLAFLWAGVGAGVDAAPAVATTSTMPAPEVARASLAVAVAEPAIVVAEPTAAPAGPRRHVVQEGDTLYKLSARYYGDASKWERIHAANAARVSRVQGLALGDELVIP
jgi:hypothetical protein